MILTFGKSISSRRHITTCTYLTPQNLPGTIVHWSTPLSAGQGLRTMDWRWLKSINEGMLADNSVILCWLKFDAHIGIYQLFKAIHWMKWSSPYRCSSTSITLSDMRYMIPRALKLYKMHLIISTSTVKYLKQVVFVSMALIYLGLMQQCTTCASFECLVPLMGFVHLSRNQSIS